MLCSSLAIVRQVLRKTGSEAAMLGTDTQSGWHLKAKTLVRADRTSTTLLRHDVLLSY